MKSYYGFFTKFLYESGLIIAGIRTFGNKENNKQSSLKSVKMYIKACRNMTSCMQARRDQVVTKERSREVTKRGMEKLGFRNAADFEELSYEQLLDCMAEHSMAVITPAPALRPARQGGSNILGRQRI